MPTFGDEKEESWRSRHQMEWRGTEGNGEGVSSSPVD